MEEESQSWASLLLLEAGNIESSWVVSKRTRDGKIGGRYDFLINQEWPKTLYR